MLDEDLPPLPLFKGCIWALVILLLIIVGAVAVVGVVWAIVAAVV